MAFYKGTLKKREREKNRKRSPLQIELGNNKKGKLGDKRHVDSPLFYDNGEDIKGEKSYRSKIKSHYLLTEKIGQR